MCLELQKPPTWVCLFPRIRNLYIYVYPSYLPFSTKAFIIIFFSIKPREAHGFCSGHHSYAEHWPCFSVELCFSWGCSASHRERKPAPAELPSFIATLLWARSSPISFGSLKWHKGVLLLGVMQESFSVNASRQAQVGDSEWLQIRSLLRRGCLQLNTTRLSWFMVCTKSQRGGKGQKWIIEGKKKKFPFQKICLSTENCSVGLYLRQNSNLSHLPYVEWFV